ncbi:hypothetical protein FRC17_011113 [Serendipita sp. 399]|nr:hypothetical protein FRC17_011113 [Serendipita sp. 399]
MGYLELTKKDLEDAKTEMEKTSTPVLDQFRVSSIAANALVGSAFYSFPPVAAASGILSPIALTIACLLLLLYRPIMLELGHAARSNGSNYTYLLQFSSRALALVAAGVTLLDATATTTVSAATASAYLSGEFSSLPISLPVISAVTMAILMVFSIISWAKTGSGILIANWEVRPTNIVREMFFGICIAFLGVSGFECTPSYVEMVAPEKYSAVISTLIYSVIVLNGPLMLLVYANLPSQRILFGTNILSILAQEVGGRWLRLLLVIDAMTVLCGGMATGIFTACNLMRTLANDGVLPKLILRPMPLTGQPFVAPLFFLFACLAMYATSRFRLVTISAVFSVTVLTVLLLYPISNIFLKFNRDRLPRKYRTSLLVTFLALAATIAMLVGNLVLSPIAIGLFASYFAFVLAGLFIVKSQAKIARVVIWLYGQSEVFRNFRFTRGLDALCVKIIKSTRRHTICVWVKGDDIYHLVEYVLYIRRNEPTGRIVFLHAYQEVQDIPSELGPNVKILDEAFPAITLDLTFVQGTFGPELVGAASKKMNIPRSRMFASCFGGNHLHSLADYRGLRLIHH